MEENEITGFILISMGGMAVMALGLILLYRVSKKQLVKQFKEKEKLKEQHQHELLEAAIDTQERERKRIASELHDHIGSNLQALKLFLHQIHTGNLDKIELQSTSLLGQTIQDVKNLSHELMPVSLTDLGLQAALNTLVNRLDASGQITAELRFEGSERLAPETEQALYRMVQELSSNTLQHARASQIQISLSISDSYFSLEYQDNGIGLKETTNQGKSGLGLKNIESRCQMLGATAEYVHDRLANGFFLRISNHLTEHT